MRPMRHWKMLAVTVGMAVVVLIGAACGNEKDSGNSTQVLTGPTASSRGEAPSTIEAAVTQLAAAFPGSAVVQTGGQAGIWVTGEATITMEPDLAVLNIGVETTAKTVKQAREEAATAMAAVVDALKARGVEDRDIQTRSFNIFPQYEFEEIIKNGRRTGHQVLVGYRVSNSAAVNLRDLDGVGVIIDEVADAGGDAIRINGISFTVEDPKPLTVDLREQAVADALAKADQFASLTGVVLGKLVFISEAGGRAPVVSDFGARGLALEAAAPLAPTSISGGELELRMSVQAVFEIR